MKRINGETPRQRQLRRRETIKGYALGFLAVSIVPMMILHWIIFGYVH